MKKLSILGILLLSHITVGYCMALYGARRGFDAGAQAVYDYMTQHQQCSIGKK